jgi:hypothetical protein
VQDAANALGANHWMMRALVEGIEESLAKQGL